MMDKMILGNNYIHDMDCGLTGLNNNVVVVGGTGSGKTKSIVEPQLLYTNDTSLVVVVSKRAVVERYSKVFKERGYKVLDLNMANPKESQIGYDPLANVGTTKDIVNLARAIVFSSCNKENAKVDPYWTESAASLLSAIIGLVVQGKEYEPEYMTWKKGENPTFNDVLKLYHRMKFKGDNTSRSTLDRFFEEAEFCERGNFATACWRTVCDVAAKTVSCIVSTANTAVDKVFTKDIQNLIALPQRVDFEELATKKTVLFVTVSPMDIGVQTFINLFYADLFHQLFQVAQKSPNEELLIPVHIIADDFACAGVIPDFDKHISIFRAARISVSLLLQSESQLSYMYGGGQATTIINNCDTYVYMGGMDLETCKNISLRLNVPLDEVLYMPIEQVVILQRGKKPVVTKRYAITKDELYLQTEKGYQIIQSKKINMKNTKNESEEKNYERD